MSTQASFTFSASGYLTVSTGTISVYVNGLPFTAAGSLCVESAAVSYVQNGWPFTSNGKVAIA